MKPFAVSLLLVAVSGCAAFGRGTGNGRVDASSAFEKLRGVEGEWSGEVVEGTGEGVHPVEGRYHVTAGGSVVEATLFRGMSRETVMMFHLDDGKLMLTQYGEPGNSGTLVGDMFGTAFTDPPGPAHIERLDGKGATVEEYDVDVAASQPSGEPAGVFIRFFMTGAANAAPSDGVYLHDVWLIILKDGTKTFWNFFKDGSPDRDVFVELTHKDSLQAAAEVFAMPPQTPH
jgi:hypothetical protein